MIVAHPGLFSYLFFFRLTLYFSTKANTGTVSAIKIRKRLTKFKIMGFITAVKVTKVCRSSGDSNVEICIPHMRYGGGHLHPKSGN